MTPHQHASPWAATPDIPAETIIEIHRGATAARFLLTAMADEYVKAAVTGRLDLWSEVLRSMASLLGSDPIPAAVRNRSAAISAGELEYASWFATDPLVAGGKT